MADTRNHEEHVISNEDGWEVRVEEVEQPKKVFDNKQDAVDLAKEIAQNKGTSAIICTKEDTIQINSMTKV